MSKTKYTGADLILPYSHTKILISKEELAELMKKDKASWDKKALKKLLSK